MVIQMLDRGRDSIDVSRFDNDSFHSVADHVTGFARCDHWQSASRRLVNCFCAAFQSRWKNVDRPLVQIILEIALETENANVVSPEFLQVRLGFLVNAAE